MDIALRRLVQKGSLYRTLRRLKGKLAWDGDVSAWRSARTDAGMIIVDSNTWADYFNGVGTPCVTRLDAALEDEEDLLVIPIIVTEVLQGFRTDTGFQHARRVLVSLPMIHPTVECHVRAARLFRTLRRRGVTVRGDVDCVIAQTCLDVKAEFLSPDADFARMARHTPLRLWRA